jgi:hypothetical protein
MLLGFLIVVTAAHRVNLKQLFFVPKIPEQLCG